MRDTSFEFAGYTLRNQNGNLEVERPKLSPQPGDHGWDPIFDSNGNPTGRVRLVPSGREVTVEEARQIVP